MRPRTLALLWLLFLVARVGSDASGQTPITGHYPPGQSGVRGASTPEPGFVYTNFSRFFTNLQVVGPSGTQDIHEFRYANISMFTWTTNWKVLGLRYGALAGIPVATGDLSSSTGESGFGLGDVLITPVSLYGKSTRSTISFSSRCGPRQRVLAWVGQKSRQGLLGAGLFIGCGLLPGRSARSVEHLCRRADRTKLRAARFRNHAGRRHRGGLGHRPNVSSLRSSGRCRSLRFRAVATHVAGRRGARS